MPTDQAAQQAAPGQLPAVMKLLGNEARWRLVTALALSDRRVNELVERIQQPANLVSYHLAKLRGARLVGERRSSADARDVYYSLHLERLQAAFQQMSGAIHPGLCAEPGSIGADDARPARVLFVCTYNSARSQMAEAILRHYGGARIEVHSGGSHPTHVHPLALRTLADLGVDAAGLESKHLDAFANDRFDYVITLCDGVRELCPSWPEGPEQIHWSLADPSMADSSEEAALLAFRGTAAELTKRVRYLLPVLTGARGEDAA